MSRFIYRKQLAQELDVSVDTVRRNEKRWGLEGCRQKLNERLVRYDSTTAHKELKRRGII